MHFYLVFLHFAPTTSRFIFVNLHIRDSTMYFYLVFLHFPPTTLRFIFVNLHIRTVRVPCVCRFRAGKCHALMVVTFVACQTRFRRTLRDGTTGTLTLRFGNLIEPRTRSECT